MPNEEAIQKMSIVDPIQVNVNIPNFEGKPGRDGTDGRDGDDAYRIAVRNGFLGTEKEWLLTLKGQDGKSASAPTARQTLLKNNVWCEDDTVDSVFTAIIGNWGKPMPRTEFKPLQLESTLIVGLKDLIFSGEPHYKLKVNSNDSVEFDSNGRVNVSISSANAGDSVSVQYLGYSGNVVSSKAYTFGDAGNIFKVGNLIESKEFENTRGPIGETQKILVSVYDNKVVTMTLANDATAYNFQYQEQYDEIKTWVVSKINHVETVIIDASICTTHNWNEARDIFSSISYMFGYGTNLKVDISNILQNYRDGIVTLFYKTSTDSNATPYIGKFIQINDSNIFMVKQNMNDINYLVSDNTIIETTDSL